MEQSKAPVVDVPDFDDRYFRAFQIYSIPMRPGYLPYGRTQFYTHLKNGRFPEPDGFINGTPVWRGRTIREALVSS